MIAELSNQSNSEPSSMPVSLNASSFIVNESYGGIVAETSKSVAQVIPNVILGLAVSISELTASCMNIRHVVG